MTRFVLLSTQRSGSTWVVDMLNSHPGIACYGALFLPEGEGAPPAGAQGMPYFSTYLEERGLRRGSLATPLRAWRYANEVYRSGDGAEAVGFKLMYSQFRVYPSLLAYMAAKRVRVVHLVRRNKLDHVLSRLGASARGKFHARPGESLVTPKLLVNVEELLRRLEREEAKVERARRVLSVLRPPRLEVAYEDLASDREAFTEVLSFLRVEPLTDRLDSSLRKWSRGSYADRIENYAEVQNALVGTRFAGLLGDLPEPAPAAADRSSPTLPAS